MSRCCVLRLADTAAARGQAPKKSTIRIRASAAEKTEMAVSTHSGSSLIRGADAQRSSSPAPRSSVDWSDLLSAIGVLSLQNYPSRYVKVLISAGGAPKTRTGRVSRQFANGGKFSPTKRPQTQRGRGLESNRQHFKVTARELPGRSRRVWQQRPIPSAGLRIPRGKRFHPWQQ